MTYGFAQVHNNRIYYKHNFVKRLFFDKSQFGHKGLSKKLNNITQIL